MTLRIAPRSSRDHWLPNPLGIEIARHLVGLGREVAVVELRDDVERDMEAIGRKLTLKHLSALPVTVHTQTRLLSIEHREAHVRDESTGEERSLGSFDSVVVAVGHRSHDPLSETLRQARLVHSVRRTTAML